MLDETFRGSRSIIVESFDYNCHWFELVEKDNKYFLRLENDPRFVKKIVLKPDLLVVYENDSFEHGVKLLKPINLAQKKVLSMEFYIDPEIFGILVENKLISYSKAMADLYDLPVEFSRDCWEHRRDYKHSKNKELILEKWKKGIFN